MTIHSVASFVGALWDWAILQGCFPRRSSPTDLDGMVELGGRFLVLEGKRDGAKVGTGQAILFDQMIAKCRAEPGLFTVIVFWGDPQRGAVSRIQFWPHPPMTADTAALRQYCQAWGEWADAR